MMSVVLDLEGLECVGKILESLDREHEEFELL